MKNSRWRQSLTKHNLLFSILSSSYVSVIHHYEIVEILWKFGRCTTHSYNSPGHTIWVVQRLLQGSREYDFAIVNSKDAAKIW